MRIRATLTLTLVVVSTAALVRVPALRAVRLLARSWGARVAVAGRSMEPALEDGDWLLVDPDAYARRPPRPGELVLAPDPREPERLLIKRVSDLARDGRISVRGDASDGSTDSRTFGPVDAAAVRGRPWFRYWPPERLGPLR